MRTRRSLHSATLAACVASAIAPPSFAAEQTISTLACRPAPAYPYAGLAMGKAGNLFTTSFDGGADNLGAVFELSPPTSGSAWTTSELYSFGTQTEPPPATDATNPQSLLLRTKTGTLVGTGYYSNDLGCGGSGCGAVFSLTPQPGKKTIWTEQVLYDFKGGTDGETPVSGVITDTKGNYYGTTEYGGPGQAGTVYEMVPPAHAGAPWTETPLFAFANGADGGYPMSGLIMDAGGRLYGTTPSSGNGAGLVFRLNPPASLGGAWTETVLYTFGLFGGPPNDGNQPGGGVILDSAGNLYGTTLFGGSNGRGAAFKLTPPAAGQTTWGETTLYSFKDKGDGALPGGPLLLKGKALLGTAQGSGNAGSNGNVFKLTPRAPGDAWKETILYSFTGGADGQYPLSGLISDTSGNFYGTTLRGGADKCGVVFEVTP